MTADLPASMVQNLPGVDGSRDNFEYFSRGPFSEIKGPVRNAWNSNLAIQEPIFPGKKLFTGSTVLNGEFDYEG